MEKLEYTLTERGYWPVIKNPTDRMGDVSLILDSDIRMSDGKYIKSLFDKLFSREITGFSTDISNVELIDDNHVKIRFLHTDFDEWDEVGTIIDKEQLYYLIDEWVRLVKERVSAITVTYDNGVYTIEGK